MSRTGEKAMIAFILLTIVMGLFGPWIISLILALLCAGCWFAGRASDFGRRRLG